METREHGDSMKALIKEYEVSEAEVIRTKKLYDELQHLVLQENEKQRKEESEFNSVKKVSSETSSTLQATNSRSSSKNFKDTKSSPALISSKSPHLEGRTSISKSVERRIHHLENYKNILKQSKVPTEKLAFMNLLNSS